LIELKVAVTQRSGQAVHVEDRVDLDRAVVEVVKRATSWRAAGLTVGDVTWRAQGEGWPPKLKTDRTAVRDPDSIGVRCTKGDQEGEVVLFKGGWADFEYWSGTAGAVPVLDAPGTDGHPLTVETSGHVLDRLFELFG
jgi:hypothetical protein